MGIVEDLSVAFKSGLVAQEQISDLMEGVDISGSVIQGLKLDEVRWRDVDAYRTEWSMVEVKDCHFIGVDFSEGKWSKFQRLSRCVFERCNFEGGSDDAHISL